MYFTWRLRDPPTNPSAYAWLDKYDAYLVAYDNSNDSNLHVHILISTSYKEASVRSHLDKNMTIGHGNQNRSLKVVKEVDVYLRYMCKPVHTFLAKKGYTDVDLSRYRSEYKEFPTKKLSNNSKSRILDIKKYIEDVCFPERTSFANRHIVDGIIKYYSDKGLRTPCMFNIKTLVMTLKLHMVEGYEKELAEAYMSQLWYKDEYGNIKSL